MPGKLKSTIFALGRGRHTTDPETISVTSQKPWQSRMGKRPIKLSCFGIQGTKWKCTIIDTRHRYDFGIISSRENLVGFFEVIIAQGFLDHGDAGFAQ